MRILVTGGSSFIGAHLCRLGASKNHQMIALYHRTPVRLPGVHPLRCDLREEGAARLLRGLRADALVHAAFKVRRATSPEHEDDDQVSALNARMMDVVLSVDLPIVYASSTVVHWPRDSAYRRDRRRDEERLRTSGRPWAVLRPCAPYGPRLRHHRPAHRESFHTLADIVRYSPIVPVLGDGCYRRQPIHVDDFNGALIALLERGLPCRAFDAGGAAPLTFRNIVETMARFLGKKARILPVPLGLAARTASFTRHFDPEQLSQIDSDEVVDPTPLREASGIRPRHFEQGCSDLYAVT